MQVEGVVCQNSRTEWSTAVCDSCVAQLGKTDNPQPAEADNTATFLLRRLKIPSAGPCSHSLPLLHTSHSCALSKWFFLFQAVSSCPHYIPHPFSVLFISLQWPTENTWPRLWARRAAIRHLFIPSSTGEKQGLQQKWSQIQAVTLHSHSHLQSVHAFGKELLINWNNSHKRGFLFYLKNTIKHSTVSVLNLLNTPFGWGKTRK